jgi:uncharacterized membrane protein
VELFNIYHPILGNYEIKVSRAMADSAKNISWETGLTRKNFANTAIYPPFVYIMPALGIAVGKLFNLSVVKTFYVARMLNGYFVYPFVLLHYYWPNEAKFYFLPYCCSQ